MTTITLRCALRSRLYPCQCAGGEPGMLLHLNDATGLIKGSFVAIWRGPEALAFKEQHHAELIPGRCVDLTVNRIRAIGDKVRVDVLSCSLAPLPPSWTAPTVDPCVNVTNMDS